MNKFERLFLADIHEKVFQIAGKDAELTRKLNTLAIGILATIDGESAFLPPFKLIPKANIPAEDKMETFDDISGNLHNNYYNEF